MKLPNTLTEIRVVQIIRAEMKRWHRKNPSNGGGVIIDPSQFIDGGASATVYTPSQQLDGGSA